MGPDVTSSKEEIPELPSGSFPPHEHELFKVYPVTVTWENVTYRVKDKQNKGVDKTILNKVNGRVAPGSCLAILGPSGCGKTTLLDVLADRVKLDGLSGDILFQGQPRGRWFKRIASYVSQEDSLQTTITVRETLHYAACLMVPNSLKEKRPELVESVIQSMGLSVCADTRVGDLFFKGLSGGQKRRLSIGVELIKNPSLLFLDEPTSGLDSASAYEVMKYLIDMAESGHTLITTIHQPSSEIWELIDNIMLLSKGEVVYYGKSSQVLEFFVNSGYPCPQYANPADFLLRLINTDFPNHGNVEELIVNYQKSPTYFSLKETITHDREIESNLKEEFSSHYVTSYWDHFLTLSRRTFKDNLRNPGVFWVRIFMYVALSFMCGTMYLDKNGSDITPLEKTSLLFYVAAFLVFMSVAVLPFFIMERSVFVREKENGMYNVAMYCLARFTQSLPGIFLIAILSTALVVPLAGLNGFGVFLVDLFLALCIAESFMQVMAALVPHYIIGMALGAGVYGMFMLCEGYLITKPNIPKYWIWGYYIAFHTYSFRVFMYNEFKDSDPALLKQYDMEDVDVWSDLLVLLAYVIGFQAIFMFLAARSSRR